MNGTLKVLLYSVFVTIILLGTAYADDNEISYPLGGEFVISKDFIYMGRVPYPVRVNEYTGTFFMPPNATSSWKVYILNTDNSSEATEIIGVLVHSLPDRWYMREQGIKQARYYKLNIGKDEKLLELLRETNKNAAQSYTCGQYHNFVYNTGSRAITYCLSSSVIPKSVDIRSYIAENFIKRVSNKSTDQKYSNPSIPVPVPPKSSPTIVDSVGLTGGTSVAITFSKTLNTIYLGRSQKSGADAHEQTLSRCKANDCRSIYVTNDTGCASFAQGTSFGWGKARGASEEESKNKALNLCGMYSIENDCSVTATICPE